MNNNNIDPLSENNNQDKQEAQEQLLRLNADFANYKRRIEKERLAWIQSGQVSVIKPILEMVTDFDRAMDPSSLTASSGKPDTLQNEVWVQGLKLIQKNMHKMLTDLGIQQIDCTAKFDPHLHEALAQIESPDHQTGDIVQVFSPGYIYKGEVIKHAQVGVAK